MAAKGVCSHNHEQAGLGVVPNQQLTQGLLSVNKLSLESMALRLEL